MSENEEKEMFPTVNLRFVQREEHILVDGNYTKAVPRKVLQQQYVSLTKPARTEWRDVKLVAE